jgi:hypothetical protein
VYSRPDAQVNNGLGHVVVMLLLLAVFAARALEGAIGSAQLQIEVSRKTVV